MCHEEVFLFSATKLHNIAKNSKKQSNSKGKMFQAFGGKRGKDEISSFEKVS